MQTNQLNRETAKKKNPEADIFMYKNLVGD
jgi:hypothetical protein